MLDPWFNFPLGGADAALLIAVKVTFILLLARFALRLMHRAPASIRHSTIALALVSSLTLPLLTWVLPAWNVVPRPSTMTNKALTALQPAAGTPRRSSQTTAFDRRSPASSPTLALTNEQHPGLESSGGWLVIGWSLVTSVLLTLLLARVLASTLAVHRAEPIVDEDWLTLLATTRSQLGVRRLVDLRRRSSRSMPLVWGLVRPTVLLPADCNTWSQTRRRTVLAHELGHVCRRDIPVALISHLACAVHWFNPLVWWLQRRLTFEREKACDQLVTSHGVPSAIYADHLLETAMAYRSGAGLAPVMAARSQLEGRIMALLENTPERRPSRTHACLVAGLVALVLVPIASLTFASPGADSPQSSMADEHALEAEAKRLQERLQELQAQLSRSDEHNLGTKDRQRAIEQIRELKARSEEVHERFHEAEARRLELEQFRRLEAQSERSEGQLREAEAQQLVLQQLRDLEKRASKSEEQARQAEAQRLELELWESKARVSKVEAVELAAVAARLQEELRNLEARVSEIDKRAHAAEARRLEAERRNLEESSVIEKQTQ